MGDAADDVFDMMLEQDMYLYWHNNGECLAFCPYCEEEDLEGVDEKVIGGENE